MDIDAINIVDTVPGKRLCVGYTPMFDDWSDFVDIEFEVLVSTESGFVRDQMYLSDSLPDNVGLDDLLLMLKKSFKT